MVFLSVSKKSFQLLHPITNWRSDGMVVIAILTMVMDLVDTVAMVATDTEADM